MDQIENMDEREVICTGAHDDERLTALATAHLLDEPHALRMAELFKALADPTRVRIISLLANVELCVGDLCLILEMSQPAVSHQLRVLRSLRIVRTRRDGRHVFYTLDDEHVHDLFRQGMAHVRHT